MKHAWEAINPPSMAKPVGYAHAVVSAGGRRIHLAGQVAMDAEGRVLHPGDLVEQATLAFRNLAAVLAAAGGEPGHLVRMRIYVLDVRAWKAHARPIGAAYREVFGRWYPAMTLVQVAGLYDEGALVEVEGEAVVPA